jgi:hypothetical protein
MITSHASTGLITLLGSSRKLELLLLYVHIEQPRCLFDQYLIGSSESMVHAWVGQKLLKNYIFKSFLMFQS